MLFALTITAVPHAPARAQEKAVEFALREEMIDAITNYIGPGTCETLNRVLGPGGDLCRADSSQERLGKRVFAKVALEMWLPSATDADLIAICTRIKVPDCEKRPETSTGKPVLTFHASVGVKGATSTAAWSPDNRFLLVHARPKRAPRDTSPPLVYTLIIDIEQRQSRALIADQIGIFAVAWSPDGKTIAANKQRAIHLYASDTLEEKGRIAGAGSKCGVHNANRMAFTANSSALWVACGGLGGSYRPLAIAIKLGVTSPQVEDRLFIEPPVRKFRTTAIARFGGDLILVGEARDGSFEHPQLAARSFSLGTKQPLHPPVAYVSPERSETSPDAFLTDDLSGVLIRFSVVRPDGAELWSARSGERIARLNPKTMMDGRSLGAPNRIPGSPLHIEEEWLPGSLRRTVVVLDSRTGATLQEIGPVSGSRYAPLAGTRNFLVSPDGKMVAYLGRHEIRFYRVNATAAAPQPTQGQ